MNILKGTTLEWINGKCCNEEGNKYRFEDKDGFGCGDQFGRKNGSGLGDLDTPFLGSLNRYGISFLVGLGFGHHVGDKYGSGYGVEPK